ncbi:MAG: serine hydrolase domain-containing protein [Chloroflexota bacterium]
MNRRIFSIPLTLILILVFALAGTQPALAEPAHSPDDPVELEAFVDEWMSANLESNHIVGATVSVVRDGETFFAKGYGSADLEKQIPVEADQTLFRIGSITKLFTWTAVMQLAEQGRLDLDADVNTYLDFRIPDTFPEPITLRHLLSHSAGFEDRNFGFSARTPDGLRPLGEWLSTHIPARVRAPGEFSAYSNYGAALAGYIVERVSGQPYAEYVHQHILQPLHMDSTSVGQTLPVELARRMSVGYDYVAGEFQLLEFDLLQGEPMGSMTSTATDMTRFMLAHLQNGRGILSAETEAQMQSQLFTHDPRLNGFAYGFYEMSQNGQHIIGHGGDIGAFHSLLALLPEHGLGIFISFNTADAMDTFLVETFLGDFMDHYFPTPEPARAASVSTQADLQRQVGGSYRMTRSTYTTLEKMFSQLLTPVIVQAVDEGTLQVFSAYGQFRFLEVEPLLFREEGGSNLLAFRTDGQGRATHAFIDNGAFEKLAWYESPILHFALLGISLLLLASEILATGIRFLRRKRTPQPPPRNAILARRLLNGAAWLGLLFPATVILGSQGYVYGEMGLFGLGLALPIAMSLLVLGAAALTIRAWRERWWTLGGRIHYSLVVLAAFAYLWFLNFWNILGWKIG